MTTFRSRVTRLRPHAAAVQCAATCAIGLALLGVPPRYVAPARTVVERTLAPAQTTVAPWLDAGHDLVDRVVQTWRETSAVSGLQARISELEARNHDLVSKLQAAHADIGTSISDQVNSALPPLLQSSLVEARVLGRQGRSYLARRDLLDVGTLSGAEPDALVLDPPANTPAVLDVGRDGGLAPHQHVAARADSAHLVWGKLAEVGRLTSTLCRATDAGYRDLAQLAHRSGAGWRLGARGVVEGTGQRLCRLTHVAIGDPVEVGDLVFAADANDLTDGAAPGEEGSYPRLLYGRVVRVERPVAGSYWEIWVEPAIAPQREPARVAVVTSKLNPDRLAQLQHREPEAGKVAPP